MKRPLKLKDLLDETQFSRQKFSIGDIVKIRKTNQKAKIVGDNSRWGGASGKDKFTLWVYNEGQRVSWYSPKDLVPWNDRTDKDLPKIDRSKMYKVN